MKQKISDFIIGSIAVFAFLILLIENISFFSNYTTIIRYVNLAILLSFMFDVLLRFFTTNNKKLHFAKNWFDLIVFIPLVQFIHGIESLPFSVIIRQIVIITMLISRTKRVKNFFTLLHLKPAQVMISSFLFTIFTGAILLMLPAATTNGRGMGFLNAIFTATSATCVTGLIVRDTATYLTLFGQSVILGLIQLGGLGIMTFSVSLTLILGKQLNFSNQTAMQEILDQETLSTAKKLTSFIIIMTLIIEFTGAIILFFLWKDRFDFFETIYHAFFHSISAFCNAGFSTFSDSLVQFSGDFETNLTISLLIITGGLGFPVIRDIIKKIKYSFSLKNKRRPRLRVQSKISIYISILLVISGTLLIYFFESDLSFQTLDLNTSLITSFFQSVTTRTAGFNSCNIGSLSSVSLFLIILYMFIGASPGSTGGGIKTTTFFVLFSTMFNSLRGKNNIDIQRRTIPETTVRKSINLLLISITIVLIFFIILLYFEKKPFLDILFETVSAFGTVGLSTGITSELTSIGKIFITILMFIGRLGPLTIAYALIKTKKPAKYFYPEEKVMIG